MRFQQLVAEQPRIAEIDINPLLASPERLIALDARVVLHPATIPDADLPRLAIRPYPRAYVRESQDDEGKSIVVRPIRPEDEPALVEFHGRLSEADGPGALRDATWVSPSGRPTSGSPGSASSTTTARSRSSPRSRLATARPSPVSPGCPGPTAPTSRS